MLEDFFIDIQNIILSTNDKIIFNKNKYSEGILKAYPILFESNEYGVLQTDLEESAAIALSSQCACFLHRSNQKKYLDYQLKVLAWVKEGKVLIPEIADWIGVYFKASYLLGEDSKDLILGPFLGEVTEHVRISIERGFCGMALREERIVNVEDVHADDTHIACSLSTKSELVIPLKNKEGQFIAELDIDSNKASAFNREVEEKMRLFALTFPSI